MTLPDDLVALLRTPVGCFLATVMPDGSPQLTKTWVDTDGTHILVNTVRGHQKERNIGREPRVALNVADPARPSRYWFVRGKVTHLTEEGGAEHIDMLSMRYTGRPYAWYGGRDQRRVIVSITPHSVHAMG